MTHHDVYFKAIQRLISADSVSATIHLENMDDFAHARLRTQAFVQALGTEQHQAVLAERCSQQQRVQGDFGILVDCERLE